MWAFLSIFIFVILLALLVLTFVFKGNVSTDRLYMVYYEDGLWDLYLGAIFLLLGIAEWLETPLIGIIPAVLYPVLLAAKQGITAPRLRPADLPPARGTQRRTLVFLVLGLVLLCGLLVFALMTGEPSTWLRSWLDRYLATALWMLVIGIFTAWGYYSGERRLLGYAALFATAWLVSFWVELPLYLYALVLGTFISVSGLAVAVRFVQLHPKVAPG